MTLEGKRYVLVPQAEFDALTQTSGVPPLPPADSAGRRPALAFAEAAIARNIVRDRGAVGLTQRQLADAAGLRVEVLNRAERGVVIPSVRTLTKIEDALLRAGLKRVGPRKST